MILLDQNSHLPFFSHSASNENSRTSYVSKPAEEIELLSSALQVLGQLTTCLLILHFLTKLIVWFT